MKSLRRKHRQDATAGWASGAYEVGDGGLGYLTFRNRRDYFASQLWPIPTGPEPWHVTSWQQYRQMRMYLK